ncbi:hypothetical protein EYS14_02275 [Alteromonadaceae bacterium M269]|nr:hypothetical protein EYS14_02275 [Alteromonadaceae bacterium M269]
MKTKYPHSLTLALTLMALPSATAHAYETTERNTSTVKQLAQNIENDNVENAPVLKNTVDKQLILATLTDKRPPPQQKELSDTTSDLRKFLKDIFGG